MYFKDDGFSVGKKIYSKPYKSLYEPALDLLLLYLHNAAKIPDEPKYRSLTFIVSIKTPSYPAVSLYEDLHNGHKQRSHWKNGCLTAPWMQSR